MKMIQSTPVTPENCAGKLWLVPADFGFVRGISLVPLVAAELPAAQAEFPILIQRGCSGLNLVAVVSAGGQSNCFLGTRGTWQARYTPFLLRFYPFVHNPSRDATSTRLAIFPDANFFGEKLEGDWFFDDDGVRNPVLDQIEDDLGCFLAAQTDTASALQKLEEAGVLEPFEPQRYDENLRLEETDLFQINEERLKSLPTSTFMALRDADAIPIAYCHLLSLQHLAKLLEGGDDEAPVHGPSHQEKDIHQDLVNIVDKLIRERNPYSALSFLRRSEEMHGSSPIFHQLKATVLSHIGHHDTAARMFVMLAEEGQLDAHGQREWIAAFLRAECIGEAQNLMAAAVPPTEVVAAQTPEEARAWAMLRLELAAKQGESTDDLVTLAKFLVSREPQLALHHLNLAAVSRDSEEVRRHTAQALHLGSQDPDIMYRCVTELGVANPAEWLWRACEVRPLTLSSAKAYKKMRGLLPPSLKALHERIADIWSSYPQEELRVTFGDYGLPYQAFEPLQLPGSRPTLSRLEAYGLHKHLSQGARGLDIGCNNGYLLLGLRDQLSSGEGFDISKACVEIGSAVADHLKADHIRLQHKTYEQFLETKPEPFDLVIACAVHRWIGAPLETLDIVLRNVMKPGGLVLIESQGRRSPDQIEERFHERIDALALRGYKKVHEGLICDDGINGRAFALMRAV